MGQQGSHVFRRIVGLQVRRLTGQNGIGSTVAFVESIPGKLLQQIKDSHGLGPRNLIRLGTPQHKGLLLLGHLLGLLFAHRPPQ